MTDAARKLLDSVLALSEDERVKIASEVLASLDGPPDVGWGDAWLAELERREEVAVRSGNPAPEWWEVRSRIVARLDRG